MLFKGQLVVLLQVVLLHNVVHVVILGAGYNFFAIVCYYNTNDVILSLDQVASGQIIEQIGIILEAGVSTLLHDIEDRRIDTSHLLLLWRNSLDLVCRNGLLLFGLFLDGHEPTKWILVEEVTEVSAIFVFTLA